MSVRATIAVAATLAAAAALAWFWKGAYLASREKESREAESPRAHDSEDPSQEAEPSLAREGAATREEAPAATTSDRSPASSGEWAGKVLSDNGAPIEGARVSWTAWTAADSEWEPAWQRDDFGELDRVTLEATSGPDGYFEFEDALGESLGSVLWATHPGFEAACRLQAASEEASGWTLRLASSTSIQVRVVDTLGRPIPDASVEQFGLTPGKASRGSDGRTLERARRLLARRYTTNETGIVEVGPFPGEQVLVARRGAESSAPWRGAPQVEVTLTVGPSFFLGGTVELPDWSHLDYTGERRITVSAVGDEASDVLASLRSIVEGDWGPLTLPVLEGISYELVLEGAPILPVRRRFAALPAGGHLQIDLIAELGHELWFWAENKAGQVLLDAEVESHYEHEGVRGIIRRRARPDGLLNPWSFPSGALVRSYVSAPGYAGQWAEDVTVPELNPVTRTVLLLEGTTVKGRVTHSGRPVEDFEVVLWKPSRAKPSVSAHSFRARADGRFELESAPTGTLLMAASSRVHPQGPSVQVLLPTNQEVELLLPETLLGRGQVVDLETGEPIADATVQVFVATNRGPLRPWGEAHQADAEGRFEIAGFTSTGPNCVRVEAEGFAQRTALAQASTASIVEFGRIGVFKPQTLELRLTSETPIEFAAFSASATGEVALPSRKFDEDGLLRYEGVAPGRCDVLVEGPDFPWVSLALHLEHGKPWTFTHHLRGGRRLEVEIVAPPEVDYDRYAGLYVRCVARGGVTTEWGFPMPRGGSFTMEGIDADAVAVSAATYESAGIEVETVSELADSGVLRARLDLGADAFILHVLDPTGAPIPGVTVRLTDTLATALLLAGTTSEAGTCSFRGVPSREVLVHLDHESLGRAYHRIVDARAGSASVVLDPTAALELRLRDGAQPAAGLEVKALVTPIGPRWTTLGYSDSEGRFLSEGLGEGNYPIALEALEYWPQTLDLRAAKPRVPTVVQVRRRGGVRFHVEGERATQAAGLVLELVSLEFATSVRTWLDSGAASGGLVIDPAGEARVERIPHGTYSWSLGVPGAAPLQGTCEVPAGRVARVNIRVP